MATLSEPYREILCRLLRVQALLLEAIKKSDELLNGCNHSEPPYNTHQPTNRSLAAQR
jgi:hypothetical protein